MRLKRALGMACAIGLGVSGGPASAAGTNSWEEIAAQWLNASFHQPGGRWVATVLAAPPGWESAVAQKRVVIEGAVRGAQRAKSRMALAVWNPETRARGELKIQAACFMIVPVANRLLTRGQTLGPGDWHWVERDRAGLPPDVLSLERDLQNKRVKKFLCAQEPISAHALELLPDVPRGKPLVLQVRGDGVVVTADAEALTEGRVGDVIKVKICASGKKVTASVAGAGTAELVLAPETGQP